MLNMFWMLIHPSSGACDLFVELFHGLYCPGSKCAGVTLWFGCGGVVSVCRHQHTSNQSNTTHEITQQISRKLLRMDVLTSETCWTLNKEIIKQVTSIWSLFYQGRRWLILGHTDWETLWITCAFQHVISIMVMYNKSKLFCIKQTDIHPVLLKFFCKCLSLARAFTSIYRKK